MRCLIKKKKKNLLAVLATRVHQKNGLTSAATNVTIQGKTVFPLVNAANITAIQSYQVNNPNITLRIHD
jgi:hypothetical protein